MWKGVSKLSEKINASQPIDRLFSIIEYLSQNRLPVRLVDIAAALNMAQPTVLRYLRSLCAKGYVYHDENTGLYALTWKICKLSDSINIDMVLKSMASPYLTELANIYEVGACLVVRHGYGTLYLDFVGDPLDKLNTTMRIGRSAPIHTTGSGKVIMASLSDREIDDIINNVGLPRLTKKTITDRKNLFDEISKVRKCGYGIDDEECEEDHKCVSVPVYDYTGSVAAAISAFGTADKMTEDFINNNLISALKEIAKKISFRLGFEIQ